MGLEGPGISPGVGNSLISSARSPLRGSVPARLRMTFSPRPLASGKRKWCSLTSHTGFSCHYPSPIIPKEAAQAPLSCGPVNHESPTELTYVHFSLRSQSRDLPSQRHRRGLHPWHAESPLGVLPWNIYCKPCSRTSANDVSGLYNVRGSGGGGPQKTGLLAGDDGVGGGDGGPS
jgi:hypothetical protein